MSPMTEHDQSKKFVDKSAATANKAFATVEQSPEPLNRVIPSRWKTSVPLTSR